MSTKEHPSSNVHRLTPSRILSWLEKDSVDDVTLVGGWIALAFSVAAPTAFPAKALFVTLGLLTGLIVRALQKKDAKDAYHRRNQHRRS